jgi:RNA:NAD 2'-phosphotransferase (TPT1/KptA family)
MNRQHIHIVENKKNVLYYSEVIIKIDIQKAKSLGIKFIKSDNNYILTNNIIPPECLSIEEK